MQYRRLGRTGIEVSTVALGCWAFAGGTLWGEQDESQVEPTINAALGAGINLFDTAEIYGDGLSEQLLGRALGARRDQALIASKVSSKHLSKEGVRAACEGSLRRLRTDYIDLYQIHWPGRDVPLAETIEALEQLRDQGKIRVIGVSNFGPKDMADLTAVGRVESNQLLYSLLSRMIEHDVIPRCVEEDISMLCYSPIAQGMLTDKWPTLDDIPEERARPRLFSGTRPATSHHGPGCESLTSKAIEEIRRISRELGEPTAAVALAWCLHQPGITSVLAGARSPAQVTENAHAGSLKLDSDVVARLSAATDPVKAHLGTNLDFLFDGEGIRYR